MPGLSHRCCSCSYSCSIIGVIRASRQVKTSIGPMEGCQSGHLRSSNAGPKEQGWCNVVVADIL